MSNQNRMPPSPTRLLYVSLQPAGPGDAAHAHIKGITENLPAWISVHRIGVRAFRGHRDGSSAIRRLFEALWVQMRAAARCPSSDIVYIRHHAVAAVVVAAALVCRVPVILELNGAEGDFVTAWPGLRLIHPLLGRLSRYSLRRAAGIVVVSAGLVRWLRDLGVTSPVALVPNGVDPSLFTPNARLSDELTSRIGSKPYVVFVGSFSPWQGIDLLLSATSASDWPKDTNLVIAGDGRLRDLVVKASQDSDRVIYLGQIVHAETAGLYANALASLVLKTSVAGHDKVGLSPIKLFESMATGTPVVASRISGLQDVVRKYRCGLVLQETIPEEVAAAVSRLRRDHDLRRKLGRNGRKAASSYCSWRARALTTAEFISTILGRADRHSLSSAEPASPSR